LPTAKSTGIDDWQLLDRWHRGDSEAGSELVTRYFNSLRSYFHRRVPEDDAEDLVQETFLRLFAYTPPPSGKPQKLRALIFRIARALVMARFRNRLPLTQNFDETLLAPASSDDLFATQAQRQLLLAALDRIPLSTRELLEFAYEYGFRVSELGELFGIPEATVRGRIARARQQLRKAFAELSHGDTEAPASETPDESTLGRWLEELRT
jgi:RNA polymerase sigma-70 factor (ECF subfamily)